MWAVGTLVALVTIAMLVANLEAANRENLSRERIEQVALFIGIAIALTTLIVLLAIGGASLGWTGFGDKKLWDWLQLLSALAVPVVLAIAGFWFTTQQEARQQRIETLRAESEEKIAEQRAQDEALQAYLDQIGQMLLDKERPLRESKPGDEVQTLARARTLTVLARLDGDRKGSVMQFLYESGLIIKDPVTIFLEGADLSEANLRGADLTAVQLQQTNLVEADLRGASLGGANLSEAILYGANLNETGLSGADLRGADLSEADLNDANLSNANLLDAGISNEDLEQQTSSLKGAIMPDGLIYPGRYADRWFEPAVSFEVGEGWYIAKADDPLTLSYDHILVTGPKGGKLNFTNPGVVFDPSNPSEPKELPGPENADEWVSWFQNHPNLDTSKPVPVSVGGVSGKKIDVTYSSTSENYPRDFCSQDTCIPLYKGSTSGSTSETVILSYEGFKDRFVIANVEGETVIIDAGAPEGKFDEFLPKAQKVLDSVEWKGG